MTKERYIKNIEEAYIEELKDRRPDKALNKNEKLLFSTIQMYIELLKKSDESYETLRGSTIAFSGMLFHRLNLEIETGLSTAENHNVVDKYSAIPAFDISQDCGSRLLLSMSLMKILRNYNTMQDIIAEAKNKYDCDLKVYGKEYVQNKCNMIAREINMEEEIEEFLCTKEDIEKLEKLIGPQPDFDYVMGRSIAYTKYESR